MASYNIPNKPCKLTIHILTPAAGVGVGLVKASTLKQWSLKTKQKTTKKNQWDRHLQYTNKSCQRKSPKYKHSL